MRALCTVKHVSGQDNLRARRCRILLYEIKRAAYGGADMAKFVVLLACPHGPNPLAARGLTAVLARAGPAGAVVDPNSGLP